MLKITGLDKLQRQLEDAQRAFKALDGQLATVRFDPDKPESIEAAIRTMESAIDNKVAPYRDNAMVASIVPQLKEKYRAEPPRVCRRPFGLSYAAMAYCSSMA